MVRVIQVESLEIARRQYDPAGFSLSYKQGTRHESDPTRQIRGAHAARSPHELDYREIRI